MKKAGEYFYAPRGKWWVVYRVTTTSATGYTAEKTAEYGTKEEARQKVYMLNGWKK